MVLELHNIDKLRSDLLAKLKDEGIVNVQILSQTSVRELMGMGITEEKAIYLVETAGKMMDDYLGGEDGFFWGDELLKEYNSRLVLSTGCPSFDKILGGGFETQKVYEVYGKEGTGKSSLIQQLMCIALRPVDKGGLGSPAVVLIDTEGAFSIKKIKLMAPYYNLDPNFVFKNVMRTAPPHTDAMVYICEKKLFKVMEKTGARAIFLDSLASHFRSEYGDARQFLPERQRKANRIIHSLKKATRTFNAVAVMTNQATANVSGMGAQIVHSMGLVVGHESQVRIKISNSKGQIKKIKVEKAVDLPNDDCLLELTQFGFLELDALKEWKKEQRKTSRKKETETDEENNKSSKEQVANEEKKEEITDPEKPVSKTPKVKKTSKKKKASKS